jgi:YD repeat-containing protein
MQVGAKEEYREVSSYDVLGRPLVVSQYFKESNDVWSQAFTTSQTYDLAGNVKTKTYPSGHTVTYNFDNEGELSSFTGNLGNGTSRTYSAGITYNAQGQMLREQFGTTTPLYHNRHYNRRGQLFDVRLGTSSSDEWSWNRGALRMYFNSDQSDYNTTPTYANNNGNLYRLDHFVPDNDAVSSWSMAVDYYGYDSLNRVTSIAEQTYWSSGAANYNTFSQNFSYERSCIGRSALFVVAVGRAFVGVVRSIGLRELVISLQVMRGNG